MFRAGDSRAGIPELRGDAAVARVLEHADALAVANLPADFAAELEVVALVVDGPTAVGLHVDGVVRVEDLIERLAARLQAHIGHADHWQARPAVRAHASVGAVLPHGCSRFARGHIAREAAVADDVGALRGNAFVIERERSQARPVFQTRIAHYVDDRGTILQGAQLIQREKAHAGVIGLAAQDAVKLNRVANRFVDLQRRVASFPESGPTRPPDTARPLCRATASSATRGACSSIRSSSISS